MKPPQLKVVSWGLLIAACHSGAARELLGVGVGGSNGETDAAADAAPMTGGAGSHTTIPQAGEDAGSNVDHGGNAGNGGNGGSGGAAPEPPDASDASNDVEADVPTCGDGHVDSALDEECDDGNQQHSDGCENDCTETEIADVGLGYFSCALSKAGGVKCWGDDSYGALGRGTAGLNVVDPLQVPILDFGTTRRVIQLAVGRYHACVLFEDHKMRCWGHNDSGQLGNNSQNDYGDASGEQLIDLGDIALSDVQSISASVDGTCAIANTVDGPQLYCWGNNTRGQLGIGNKVVQTKPLYPAVLDATPTAVNVGFHWVCALLSTDAARCWGNYAFGVQGIGPTNFNVGDGIGNGTVGQLPNDSTRNVKGLPGPISSIAGDYQTTCALVDGDMYCWGRNAYGEAGYPLAANGTEIWQTPRAVDLGNVSLVQVSLNSKFGCGVDDQGVVRCWGDAGADGALGYPGMGTVGVDRDPVLDYQLYRDADGGAPDGGTANLPLGAVDVGDFDGIPGVDLVAKVVAGPDRVCAILKSGRMRCWGENTFGQMGYPASDVDYIGVTDSPAEAYQRMGYADARIFGTTPDL
jgi:cysteine-rich repeat protein